MNTTETKRAMYKVNQTESLSSGEKNARLTNLSKEKKRPECNKICNKVRYKNGGYYRLQ